MANFIKNLFVKEDGDQRWTGQLLAFLAITLFGMFQLWPEIVTNFSDRIWPQGVLTVVGIIAGFVAWVMATKQNNSEGGSKGVARLYYIGAALMWAGLFGTAVGLKQDRRQSIPDVNVYYFNGRVINATDSTQKNYYFKAFELNPVDSLYVVQYGEEPGRNKRWQSVIGDKPGDSPKSTAPRADEDWKRPVTRQAQDFIDHKRPQ
jgi:hypothetical protein